MLGPLTERQRAIFEAIVDYLRGNGCPPSMREICDKFGWVSTNSAVDHLTAMRRKGWLRAVPKRYQTRSTIPTPEALEQYQCPTCGRAP